MTTPNPECAQVSADLSEFALGILTGRDRSRVLSHVASCPQCRDELDALSTMTDRLVELAPQSEAPIGFESRLLDRYHAESGPRRIRARRNVALAAAALILVALSFTLGYRGAPQVRTSQPTYGETPISATLSSQGRPLGQLWMSPGSPAWIYMSFNDAGWSGTAWCRVTLNNGHVLDVGVFSVVRGYGAWASRVDAPSSDVRSAQVTDVAGHVLASATLST